MLIDLTLKITKEMLSNIGKKDNSIFASGHIGTHFDVMDKEFPLEYMRLQGKLIDVSNIRGREIEIDDITPVNIEENDFVIFKTDYILETDYGSTEYFKKHPELSDPLIDHLISKKISLIGIDTAGIKRGSKHTPADQYCADNGIFVIENLNNLNAVEKSTFLVYCLPMNVQGLSGLPCRVIAEV